MEYHLNFFLGKGDFGVVFAESYWKKVGLM